MPLGMEVGLIPGNFVFDGDPATPPRKGGGTPQFSAYVYCGQMAGCIKMPLGTEVGLVPDDIVLDGDPLYGQLLDSDCGQSSCAMGCDTMQLVDQAYC